MFFIKRTVNYFLLTCFFNFTLLAGYFSSTIAAVLGCFALVVYYIRFNIRPRADKSPQKRLGLLIGGYELTLAAIACFTLEVLIYIYTFLSKTEIAVHILIINALLCVVFLGLMLLNGIVRIFACSGQLGIMTRVWLLLFWWVPVVNIILLRKFLSASSAEYVFTTEKYRLNMDRKHEQLCKTKYPLLMVHGIFFRDWKNLNYWGRIPAELIANGATVYYGDHQSSASVEQCADELRQCILNVVKESKCEKVNIIAHSKGGLDSRYAVGCLGMDKYVASVTTINTPHLGCNYVRRILDIIPQKAVSAVAKGYEAVYSRLGDDNPDFFSGLSDLTDKECARLNKIIKDPEGVLYQSVGSRMRSSSSAMFPLNIGYRIIKLAEGENDGLVSTKSMAWGDFLGILNPKGKMGISHGDVIDLTRKNIEGFDVCEFYVDLVNNLRLKGL